MRRAAFLLGIVLAALLGGAIYVSAQPTGGTAPPYPWNPARYKDAPGPPTGVPEVESWGGSGRFGWGDVDSRTGAARLSFDLGGSYATLQNPLDAILRFGPTANGARHVGMEISPGPPVWRKEVRYRTNDWITVSLASLPAVAYVPEAECVSGATEPTAREGFTTGMPVARHPWHRYTHEQRVVLRLDNGHRYRVNAGGAGQSCWTGGYTATYWTPNVTYPSSGSVMDGTCTMEREGTSTVDNVADGTCVWDRLTASTEPMLNVPNPHVSINSNDETFRNQLTVRHADNTASALIAHGGTINGPATEDVNPEFAVYVAEPRGFRPSMLLRNPFGDGSPTMTVQYPAVQIQDPRGMVEVVPAEGSIGSRALGAGCHWIAYAFLDQSASAGPTGISPVSIRHSYACIDGVENATACNTTTGENCDAVQITIREPVPNFAHLLIYNANPLPGAAPGTQTPNGTPTGYFRQWMVLDPDGGGASTANTTCGTPCSFKYEGLVCSGACETESNHLPEGGNFSTASTMSVTGHPGIPTTWAPSTSYTTDVLVVPTARNGQKYRLLGNNSQCRANANGTGTNTNCPFGDWLHGAAQTCTSAGSEPVWPWIRFAIIKDNTCTWQNVGDDESIVVLREPAPVGYDWDYMTWRGTILGGDPVKGGIEKDGDIYVTRGALFQTLASVKSLILRGDLNGGGGIELGPGAGVVADTNLYRGGPSQLKSDDDLLLRGTVSSQAVWLRRSDPSPYADGGGISFGPSSTGSADTGIFRVDPSYLGTEDNLWITGGRLEVGLNAEVVLDDQLGASAGSAGIAAGPGGPLDVMLLRMGAGNWGIQGSTNAIALSYRNNAGAQLWSTRVNSAQLWSLQNAGGLNVFEAEANAPRTVHIDSDGDWCSSGGASITNCPAGSAFAVDSTTGGLTPPRMTEAQRTAIATPVDGTQVYIEGTAGAPERVDERVVGAWIPASAPKGDVRRFGAKCDGVTNDTTALQNAATAGGEIHIPNGTGACLTDEITITTRVSLICEPGATLKLRTASPTVNTAILRISGGGANDSSVIGCAFDGNKGSLQASYVDGTNIQWNGIIVTGGARRVQLLRLELFGHVRFALNIGSGREHILRDISIYDSGNCILFQNSVSPTIDSIDCSDIGHDIGVEAYQHGNEIGDIEGGSITNFVVRDFHPPDYADPVTGTDPVPNAIQTRRLQRTTLSGIRVYEYTGTDSDGARCLVIEGVGLNVSDFSCKGMSEGLIVTGTSDSVFSNFVLDGDYDANVQDGDHFGLWVHNGAIYPQTFGGDISQNARSNTASRNLQFTNGVVQRFEVGVLASGSNLAFANVRSVANVRHGFAHQETAAQSGFIGGETDFADQIRYANCIAEFNGHDGVSIADPGSRITWTGGSISNNGQNYQASSDSRCTVATDDLCSGLWIAAGEKQIITSSEIGDRQGTLSADAASFKPGSAVTTRCSFDDDSTCSLFTISAIRTRFFNLGQRLVLKNATGAGDLDVLVREFDDGQAPGGPPSSGLTDFDEVIVEVPSASATFSETGNLTTLTGTFSTGGAFGTNLTGTGSALNTEIDGRTWIKADGEYRQIIRVTSATQAIIDTAFTALLSGDTAQKLEIDVDTNPTQEFGVVVGSGILGPLTLIANALQGNKQGPITNSAADTVKILAEHNTLNQIATVSLSSTTLLLPAIGDIIKVVGGVHTVTVVTPCNHERKVELLFATNGAGLADTAGLDLAGAFSSSNNDSITLLCDGSSWYELGRSIN